MTRDVQCILNQFVQEIEKFFGNSLCEIIVFGSYARGDFNENSDIDIMVLVNSTESDIKQWENQIIDCAFDLEMQYGKVLSPIVKNQEFFEYWSDTLPFYRNIKREGVKIA